MVKVYRYINLHSGRYSSSFISSCKTLVTISESETKGMKIILSDKSKQLKTSKDNKEKKALHLSPVFGFFYRQKLLLSCFAFLERGCKLPKSIQWKLDLTKC